MLEPGSVIAGKLRVERVLGRGGMGTVVAATHLGLDQRVAIKVLRGELADQPDVLARFVREARASAQLRSEHVCRVRDVAQLESGEPYIEMELLEGADLGAIIEKAPISVELAVDYVIQACVAIAEAHQLGIIHRDLKPANLFVTTRLDGSALVKVLDFGIATAPSSSEFKITKTTAVMGSPGYMSPEHLRSARDVDVRSDIWALGVILYEAVTGQLPFIASTITELAVKVVMDTPPPPPNVDPRFAAIVMKCLEKPPENRYQTVGELAADLAPFGGPAASTTAMLVAKLAPSSSKSQPIQMPAPSTAYPVVKQQTGPLALGTTLQHAAGQSQTSVPQPRRSKALLAVLGVVIAGGAAAAVVVATRSGGEASSRRDAAVAVAIADARDVVASTPPVVTTSVDAAIGNAGLRAKLDDLAKQGDWTAILDLADLEKGDPEAAKVLADARTHYLEAQTAELDKAIHSGNCTAAKAIASASAKLLPADADALTAKAASCKPPAAKPLVFSDLDAAEEAYDRGEYAKALGLAEKALAKDPKNEEALLRAALAACSAQNATKADAYVPKLAPSNRKAAMLVCRSNHVALTGLPQPPAPLLPPQPPETAADQPAKLQRDLQAMRAAHNSQNFTNAASIAQQILKAHPNEREAMKVLGIAGCKLNRLDLTTAALAKLPPRGPIAMQIHVACGNR